MITKEKAIDILKKFDFFQGQRAGRELWADKPTEIQDEDIKQFSEDCQSLIEYIKVDVPDTNVGEWIPCSERLPEEKDRYLITISDIGVVSSFYNKNHKLPWGGYETECVTAWQPLPKPYKELKHNE